MSKERIIFNAKEILRNEEAIRFEQGELNIDMRLFNNAPGQFDQRHNDINFGDTEIQLWDGNPMRILELQEHMYRFYSNFELARHLAIVGRPNESNQFLAKAMQFRETDKIRESGESLEQNGVPSAIANYFKGAFLLRIGEPDAARELLKSAVEDGEQRAICQYFYLILKHGCKPDATEAAKDLLAKGALNRYLICDVMHRFCREDFDFAMPMKMANLLISLGKSDIAQAIFAELIAFSPFQIYSQEKQYKFHEVEPKYLLEANKLARADNAFKVPLALRMIMRKEFNQAQQLINSLPSGYIGKAYLEAVFATHNPKSDYAKRLAANVNAVQTPSDLYSREDASLLEQYLTAKR